MCYYWFIMQAVVFLSNSCDISTYSYMQILKQTALNRSFHMYIYGLILSMVQCCCCPF